jgi:hypothetical protein
MTIQNLFTFAALSIGTLFIGVGISILVQPDPPQKDRDAAWGCFLLGLPPTILGGWLMGPKGWVFVGIPLVILGGWLILKLRRQRAQAQQQSQQERALGLEAIFLEQIQKYNGDITPLGFAVVAKIPIEEAKQYLEQKSLQLNGTFHIHETGGTSYHFEI